MTMIKLTALCLAAALICAMVRSTHPQIAAALALACGLGVLLLSVEDLGMLADALRRLEEAAQPDNGRMTLLRLCGVAIVAEFASDICRDAGEVALAKRIEVGVRLGITAAALPAAGEIMESIAGLLA